MTYFVLIDKYGKVTEKNFKQYDEAKLYSKAGFKKDKDFELLHVWKSVEVDNRESRCHQGARQLPTASAPTGSDAQGAGANANAAIKRARRSGNRTHIPVVKGLFRGPLALQTATASAARARSRSAPDSIELSKQVEQVCEASTRPAHIGRSAAVRYAEK